MNEPNDAHEADATGTDTTGTDTDGTETEGARATDELADLDYEQARDQLIEVVRGLEAGGLPLEESLALWEKGERLARLCERHLEGARERIEAALATVEDAPEDAEPGPSTDGRPE